MANYKLLLEDDVSEDYFLIAIHCSEEPYKMAFLLNQFAGLRLKRKAVDLSFSNKGLEVLFSMFEFEDTAQYTTYTLVANHSRSPVAHILSSGGLFDDSFEEKVTTYLLPELKKTDYFLKISSDFSAVPLRKITAAINDIKQVISAYQVETHQINSKNNLIFE